MNACICDIDCPSCGKGKLATSKGQDFIQVILGWNEKKTTTLNMMCDECSHETQITLTASTGSKVSD